MQAAHSQQPQQGTSQVQAQQDCWAAASAAAGGRAVPSVCSAAAPAGPQELAPAAAAAAAGLALSGSEGPSAVLNTSMCMQAAQGVVSGEALGSASESGQQLQRGVSLGTWSGGAGLWLSGSLAPLELDKPPANEPGSQPQQQQQGLDSDTEWPPVQPHFPQQHFIPLLPQQQQCYRTPLQQQQPQPPHAFSNMSEAYAAAAGGAAVGHTCGPLDLPEQQQQYQPLQSIPSLGTWSGGGLWMSGSYTPLEECAGGPGIAAAPRT
jgi:hypothetical protein